MQFSKMHSSVYFLSGTVFQRGSEKWKNRKMEKIWQKFRKDEKRTAEIFSKSWLGRLDAPGRRFFKVINFEFLRLLLLFSGNFTQISIRIWLVPLNFEKWNSYCFDKIRAKRTLFHAIHARSCAWICAKYLVIKNCSHIVTKLLITKFLNSSWITGHQMIKSAT